NARRDSRDWDLYMINITDNDQDVLRTYLNFYNPDGTAQLAENGLAALLDEQRGVLDVDRRNELVAEAQAQSIEEGWMIPLFDYRQILAFDGGLEGVSFDSVARPFLYDVWFTD
ncbi:MAG: hypothetical protein AB7L84_09330, partial [Acidimicrobiia bacterium]